MKIKGLHTALITPFKEDLSLDLLGLEQNIEFQIASGVDGILPLGTTGEAPTLENTEKEQIIKTAVRIAKGRVPVMVGVTSNSTAVTIANAKLAEELGADILLIATPYYNKPTQNGIYEHFQAVSKASSLPIMVYNIPGRSGVNIETSTLVKMAETLPQICSVKEASGNITQMTYVIDQIQNKHQNFSLLSGDDGLTLPVMALGGKGIVSVVSNIVPKELKQMVDYATAGNYSAAAEIHYKLLPMFKTAFVESNPIPIKAMMKLAKMPAGGCRLPLTNLTPDNQGVIKQTLSNLSII